MTLKNALSGKCIVLIESISHLQSIRRAHRQNYEVAQQKIQSINQTLSIIRSRANAESITSRDDINQNNNLGYATINNVINGNKNHSNDMKSKQHLNVSSISLENNNIVPERRNSAVSTGSASQYLATNASKSRPRCDSYGGQSNNVQNYASTASIKSDKMMHSPTYAYQQQVQIPHLHYKSHADKVAYVTNAVANAANAAASANPANNNNGNSMASPKYGRLKPLTVDTSISESFYYPPSGSANHHHQSHFQQHYTQHQHQHRHSPYSTSRTHLTPTKVKHTSSQHLHINTKPAISDDDDEDIAGQYATLLTLSDQPKSGSAHQDIENQDTDTHYTEILCRKPSAPLPLTERNHFQTKDANMTTKNQGLGGYWTTNENNERVWLSVDNR